MYNGFNSKAAAIQSLRDSGYRMASALSAAVSNPKVLKNQKVGALTRPLHLAPHNLGFDGGRKTLCPDASPGCIAACLHTAGNPVYMKQKDAARRVKTQAFTKQRAAFVALIAFEIRGLVRKAESEGMTPGVRLNATSDIAWESVGVTVDGEKVANLMRAFPTVEFYDYTKTKRRALRSLCSLDWPQNYHLTFSLAENNGESAIEVLKAGGNVAAVFDHRDGLPPYVVASVDTIRPRDSLTPGGWIVTNGDEHDFRPADPVNCIVGLKAKGDAKDDDSGFVIREV